MSLYAFQQFSPVMQLYWVLKWGTYLAQRWEQEGGVNLYHGTGRSFFGEVGYDDSQQRADLRANKEYLRQRPFT